ncbi:MAG: hypothetical protein IPJ32_08090 [Sphingobacteriaceae bacterium]|nr:hypothetical protein [Sphingobacteriaceae bacterium]
MLTFKINKQSTSITANPVFDEKNFETAMKEYEKIRLHHSKVVKAQADSLSRLEDRLMLKKQTLIIPMRVLKHLQETDPFIGELLCRDSVFTILTDRLI